MGHFAFQDLPLEIQYRIFKWLNGKELIDASKVCTHFRKVCFNAEYWQVFDSTWRGELISNKEFINLLPIVAQHVRKLHLSGPILGIVDTNFKFGKFLRNADCNVENYSPEILEEKSALIYTLEKSKKFAHDLVHCQNIESLAILHTDISALVIHQLLANNPKLESLDLSGSTLFMNCLLNSIGDCCVNLKSIRIHGRFFKQDNFIKLIENCPKLESLEVLNCISYDFKNSLGAVHAMQNLKHLSLVNCLGINDQDIYTLLNGQEDSEKVLSSYEESEDSESDCNFDCCRLLSLTLTGCLRLTDTALYYLAAAPYKLIKLDLSGCFQITDDPLDLVLQKNSKLGFINLDKCSLITDRTIDTLSNSRCNEQLWFVQISECELITDEALTGLLKNCKCLKHLIADNTFISDKFLECLVKVLQTRAQDFELDQPNSQKKWPFLGLKSRSFQKCQNNTQKPRILYLTIFDCPKVTAQGVYKVLDHNVKMSNNKNGTLIALKTFSGWQKLVDAHYARILSRDADGARELQTSWANWLKFSNIDESKTD